MNLTTSLFNQAKKVYDNNKGNKEIYISKIRTLFSKKLVHQQAGAAVNSFRKRMEVEHSIIIPKFLKSAEIIKYEERWEDKNCPMKRKLEDLLLAKLQKIAIHNALILASTNAQGQFEKYSKFGFTKIVGVERDSKIFKKFSKVAPFPYLFGDYSNVMKHLDNSYYFAGDYCAMCVTAGEPFFKNIPKGAKWTYTLGDYNRQVNGETRLERLQSVAKLIGGKARNIREVNVHGGEYLEHGHFFVKGTKYFFHCYKEKGKAKPMIVVSNF